MAHARNGKMGSYQFLDKIFAKGSARSKAKWKIPGFSMSCVCVTFVAIALCLGIAMSRRRSKILKIKKATKVPDAND